MFRLFYRLATIRRLFAEALVAFPEMNGKVELKILPFIVPNICTFDETQKIGILDLLCSFGLTIISIFCLFLDLIFAFVMLNCLSMSFYAWLFYYFTRKNKSKYIIFFPIILPIFNAKWIMFHEFAHGFLDHKVNSLRNESEANKIAKERMKHGAWI